MNSNNWETVPSQNNGKKCFTCNQPVSDSDKFCRKCGTKLLLNCSKCNKPVRPDDKFCSHCGKRRWYAWEKSKC